MDFVHLTPEQRQSFEEDGFLVIRNAIDRPTIERAVQAVDPRGVEVCDLELRAGDALFFENRIFHTAAPNRSNRVSKVLMYGYAYRWMKQEVYLESPAADLLAKADPITWQLLGGYRNVDTPPWALQKWAKRHGVHPQISPWTVEV